MLSPFFSPHSLLTKKFYPSKAPFPLASRKASAIRTNPNPKLIPRCRSLQALATRSSSFSGHPSIHSAKEELLLLSATSPKVRGQAISHVPI